MRVKQYKYSLKVHTAHSTQIPIVTLLQSLYRYKSLVSAVSGRKMLKSEKQENQPPPGYPTENPPEGKKKKCFPHTKKKGDRGFIEGCLFALCCCWLCEACF